MPDDAIARLTRLSQQRYLQSRDRRLRGTGVVRPQERDAARGTYRATTETGGTINAHLLSNVSDNQGRSRQWDGQAIQGARVLIPASPKYLLSKQKEKNPYLIAGINDTTFNQQILAVCEKICSYLAKAEVTITLSGVAGPGFLAFTGPVSFVHNPQDLNTVADNDLIVLNRSDVNGEYLGLGFGNYRPRTLQEKQQFAQAVIQAAVEHKSNIFLILEGHVAVANMTQDNGSVWSPFFGIEYVGGRYEGIGVLTSLNKYDFAEFVNYQISDELATEVVLGTNASNAKLIGSHPQAAFIQEVLQDSPSQMQSFGYTAWQATDGPGLAHFYGDKRVAAIWIKKRPLKAPGILL